jgi:hypothetical protein
MAVRCGPGLSPTDATLFIGFTIRLVIVEIDRMTRRRQRRANSMIFR